ncbi:hypothetical protein BFX80_06940 [Cobetia marina]|nr:hypothetical protein BFX80_06940 [Cobetia marina]
MKTRGDQRDIQVDGRREWHHAQLAIAPRQHRLRRHRIDQGNAYPFIDKHRDRGKQMRLDACLQRHACLLKGTR